MKHETSKVKINKTNEREKELRKRCLGSSGHERGCFVRVKFMTRLHIITSPLVQHFSGHRVKKFLRRARGKIA
jgi:hypothetical protein